MLVTVVQVGLPSLHLTCSMKGKTSRIGETDAPLIDGAQTGREGENPARLELGVGRQKEAAFVIKGESAHGGIELPHVTRGLSLQSGDESQREIGTSGSRTHPCRSDHRGNPGRNARCAALLSASCRSLLQAKTGTELRRQKYSACSKLTRAAE